MVKWAVLVSVMLGASASQAAANFPVKPDPKVTNGDYCNPKDPDFVGYRYAEKVPYCIRNVSRYTKEEIYQVYNIPSKCQDEYTIDHYVPLALGGSNHEVNLWPEHKRVKATRQNLEIEMYWAVRNGEISQKEAVKAILQAKMHPPVVKPTKCHAAN